MAGAASPSSPAASGGRTWWLESRPAEAGRTVLVRHDPGAHASEVTPPGRSVRSRVHEYGGGAYALGPGFVVWSDGEDGRLWRQPWSGGEPEPLTPATGTDTPVRYADGSVSPDGEVMAWVRETHHRGPVARPLNEIVLLRARSPNGAIVLDGGHDFVAYPRISPDGARLAWVTWDDPDMPWDATELWVARLDAQGLAAAPQKVAGGRGESVLQPTWATDGRLWYVSDRSGWWNPYIEGGADAVTQIEGEFATPLWSLGQANLAAVSEGRMACSWSQGGRDHLGVIDAAGRASGGGPTGIGLSVTGLSGTGRLREIDLDGTVVEAVASAGQGTRVVALLSSPTANRAVVSVDVDTGAVETLRPGAPAGVDRSWLSVPRAIETPSAGGRRTRGNYYPPTSAEHTGPPGSAPPLIVSCHGGPTGAARSSLNLVVQFWTSRGFAVVDVDYAGSSGYGREVRRSLAGQWGIADAEDCLVAAHHLVATGRADPSRVVMRGSSAGGFTALRALGMDRSLATAGVYYPVTDLEALVAGTHKFEAHYTDGLVGPYPAAAATYRERSVHPADLSAPVIVFHGGDDAVVPPGQSEALVRSLNDRGVRAVYMEIEGEGHGFRRAETIATCLEAELQMYREVLGLEGGG